MIFLSKPDCWCNIIFKRIYRQSLLRILSNERIEEDQILLSHLRPCDLNVFQGGENYFVPLFTGKSFVDKFQCLVHPIARATIHLETDVKRQIRVHSEIQFVENTASVRKLDYSGTPKSERSKSKLRRLPNAV